MKTIQFILVPILLLVVFLYFNRLRTKLMDRTILVGIGGAAILMVLFPDWSQTLAGIVGVGRGVDLVMYLALTGLCFLNLLLFTKTRKLEEDLTKLTRDRAIGKAES